MSRTNKSITRLLLLVVVFALPFTTFGQNNLNDKIPFDPQVKTGKLKNGLTYYIRSNSKPEKKVELRLVVNAGSILEEDNQQGLAHFIEHMAFNGSKNFKKNDIVSFLQSIGIEFGADLNAYTSFNETVYILPIPTENKEHVEKGFQILEDWASTIAFEPEEIEKERGVILEEERLGKGADDRMFKATYPKMFEGAKYAERLPIGKAEIIKTFKPEAIKSFYRDWYRPNLMAVIVVGDIDPAEAERLIKAHFEKLKNPKKQKPRNLDHVPPRTQSEGLVVTDPEATNHVLRIYYSYKQSRPQVTLGDYREFIVRRLFTSMLTQRMQELTQQAEPPFVFGGNGIGGWARGYEAYNSFALIGKNGPEPAVRALVLENERARRFGFTESELDRTKKMLMKSMERAYNEREKTESAALTSEYIRHFLQNEPVPGIENEYHYYQEFLEGITLEEVNAYAAQTIPSVKENKLVVFTGSNKADFKIPTNEELLDMIEKAAAMEVKPYEEKAIASSLMENTPEPGTIISEKENKELGFTELTFNNGVRAVLKPTDFKNDEVIMGAFRFGGQYLYDPLDRDNAEYASTLVSQLGVGQFSPTDLRKVLAGRSVSVTPSISAISEGVSGQCSANDVEVMLQLTHLYFTQPRSDLELFNSFVNKQQALYQNLAANPQATFQDSIFSILYKNHPWAPRLPKSETFARINQERALSIYKERFGNANGFTFVLVGAFNPEMIKPLLATYIGSLPSNGAPSNFKDVGLRPAKGPLKKEIRKGTEPKSLISMFWNGEVNYSDEERLKIQALVEVMNLRITETLREELSGIYGGGMNGSLNRYPYGNYSLGLSLPCGPENVDVLIPAAIAEIEKIKTNGPLETDLNKVKETWKKQYQVNVKTNRYWMRNLISCFESGTDPIRILTYEKRVDALSAKDVQEAAKKYLDMKNCVQFVLNPE